MPTCDSFGLLSAISLFFQTGKSNFVELEKILRDIFKDEILLAYGTRPIPQKLFTLSKKIQKNNLKNKKVEISKLPKHEIKVVQKITYCQK